MATTLYLFTITDPKKVGAFPPSVKASDWYANLNSYISSKLPQAGHDTLFTSVVLPDPEIDNDEKSFLAFFFENEASFNDFLSAYTLTDETLLADVATWKEVYGVTYNHQVFSLNDTGAVAKPFVN